MLLHPRILTTTISSLKNIVEVEGVSFFKKKIFVQSSVPAKFKGEFKFEILRAALGDEFFIVEIFEIDLIEYEAEGCLHPQINLVIFPVEQRFLKIDEDDFLKSVEIVLSRELKESPVGMISPTFEEIVLQHLIIVLGLIISEDAERSS